MLNRTYFPTLTLGMLSFPLDLVFSYTHDLGTHRCSGYTVIGEYKINENSWQEIGTLNSPSQLPGYSGTLAPPYTPTIWLRYSYDGDEPDCPCSLALENDQTQLNIIRAFRDNMLKKSQEGCELIKLYYQWSPVIVQAMEADDDFKADVKAMVDEILPMIEVAVE